MKTLPLLLLILSCGGEVCSTPGSPGGQWRHGENILTLISSKTSLSGTYEPSSGYVSGDFVSPYVHLVNRRGDWSLISRINECTMVGTTNGVPFVAVKD